MASSYLISSSLIRRIVLPPIPPYPAGNGQQFFSSQFWPLRIKLAEEAEFWQLPVEPLITINGENTIIRRNVAKSGTLSDTRGTVKERWSQDDYQITINGILYGKNSDTEYPESDVEKLRYYCEAREALLVECELFKIFNITRMVIESYELPFTKGENRQEYSITAYSDSLFELLIDTESNV